MTEPSKPQRKTLTGALSAIRNTPTDGPQVPVDVTPTATRAGFDTVPVPIAEMDRLRANQSPEVPRRVRGGGRTMSFSLKLRPDTLNYIYGIANSRNVPLAQVIEELVEFHERASQRG